MPGACLLGWASSEQCSHVQWPHPQNVGAVQPCAGASPAEFQCSAAVCSCLTCRDSVQCSHVQWPHPQRLSPCLHSAPQTAATCSRRLAAGCDRLRHCAASCLLSWDASLPQGLLVAEAGRDALQHCCDGVCPVAGRWTASSAARLQAERLQQHDLA